MLRSEIVTAARSYIGASWAHEGRTRGGLDCIGLIQVVGGSFGVPYTDMTGYDAAPDGHLFLGHLKKHLTINQGGVYFDGTIGLFRQNRYPCHVGIFATLNGQRSLIHAALSARRVTETRFIPDGDLRLVLAMEYPGVEDG